MTPHDPAAMPDPAFPNLTPDNHRVTSLPTPDYNCIAWATGDTTRWWQPGRPYYWPVPAGPDDFGVGDLAAAFRHLGFTECDTGGPEPGFEKIALYAVQQFDYTHASRQLPSGLWTSKLGRDADIEHDTPDAVAGGVYGTLFLFMRRQTTDQPSGDGGQAGQGV